MKGTIKFFKPEGWGKVESNDGQRLFYFQSKNVDTRFLVLLTEKVYQDEPITFDLQPSKRKSGEQEAINISLDSSQRMFGRVAEYDSERGFGKIENDNTKKRIFFHHSQIRKKQKDRYVRIEEGEPIVYSEGENEKGKVASNIQKLETRSYLQKFASFESLNKVVEQLKELAEREEWDYIKKPTKSNPVLWSYLNHTLKRLQDQEKIVEGSSSKSKKEYAYFNTGLVTPQQEEIFAYFEKHKDYKKLEGWGLQHPKWFFLEFNTNQSSYRKYFAKVPEIATYFSDAEITDLILDTRVPIIPDKEHLVKRKKRIDSDRIRKLNDEAFMEEIKDAIDLAKKRIKRNYKTAIPHFYDNKIQFLLPLSFRANKAEVMGALVVNKDENIYEAHTILSLDQAYNNARLLAKPDREWLNP